MNPNEKQQIYQQVSEHIRVLIAGEIDEITVLATVAAELRLAFPHFHWVGFYRAVLDIDSDFPDAFDSLDQEFLERLVAEISMVYTLSKITPQAIN